MFYFNNKHKRIDLLNKRPRNLSGGGMIEDHPNNKHKNDDTISSYLAYGNLVIPKKVVDSGILNPYLKKHKIKDEKETNSNNLSKTIVQAGEIVVHKKYAKGVEDYLKKHGIILPLNYS